MNDDFRDYCFTVKEFCKAHCISHAHFYKLRRLGIGPKVAKVGRKTIITEERAAEWRARLTASSV